MRMTKLPQLGMDCIDDTCVSSECAETKPSDGTYPYVLLVHMFFMRCLYVSLEVLMII